MSDTTNRPAVSFTAANGDAVAIEIRKRAPTIAERLDPVPTIMVDGIESHDAIYDAVVLVNGEQHFRRYVGIADGCLEGRNLTGDATAEPRIEIPAEHLGTISALVPASGLDAKGRHPTVARCKALFHTDRIGR